jgi:hypothetical protein
MKYLAHISIIVTLIALATSAWGDAPEPDAVPMISTVTISGNIGIPRVVMKGLPGDPVSDENGRYSAELERGWSGVVTPVREGYAFAPPSRTYHDIQASCTADNYRASMMTFTISGNAGAPGVLMRGLPSRVVSDGNGRYSVTVPYGWVGVVTPQLTGREGYMYVFEPVSRRYDPVVDNQIGQDYVVARLERRQRAVGLPMMREVPDVLVIPTTDVNSVEFAETAEDMQVMVQILRDAVTQPQTAPGGLPDYGAILGSDERRTEAFYLQGYGAMFVLEVEFSLSSPSQPRGGAEEGQEPVGDPVWRRARERLYAPPGATSTVQSGSSARPDSFSLDQFTEDLVRTLRHAANIRHLPDDEWVIVTILGGGEPGSLRGPASPYGRFRGTDPYGSSYGGGGFVSGGGYSYGGGSSNPSGSGGRWGFSGTVNGSGGVNMGRGAEPTTVGTVLTVRTKKADINAFAESQISFDQFNQRTKTFSY